MSSNTSKEVKTRVKKDNVEQKLEVGLKKYSQVLSKALREKDQSTIDSFNCSDNPTFNADSVDPELSYSCQRVTSGTKRGYVVTSKRKSAGQDIIKQAFIPFGKTIGSVSQISPGSIQRINVK